MSPTFRRPAMRIIPGFTAVAALVALLAASPAHAGFTTQLALEVSA